MGMHSRVFRMMLYNGMKESSQTEIPLVDVEKDTFLQLLVCITSNYYSHVNGGDYVDIYCGTIPNDAPLSVLVSILAAADKV
jgi:hypothetical protein